jgi:mitogen-activated protein kinase kinase kinase 13
MKTYPCGISSSTTAKQLGWTENVWRIFGCMRPVLTLIGKSHILDNEKKQTDGGWEIPFEIISGNFFGFWPFNILSFVASLFLDLEWVGSGAQGAVFSGKLNNQVIAIKKVRDIRETDVRHLAKLNHENIVKILWVSLTENISMLKSANFFSSSFISFWRARNPSVEFVPNHQFLAL